MTKTEQTPPLTLNEAVGKAWKDLLVFTGRSRRSEYWWTFLVVLIADIALSLIPMIGLLAGFLLSLTMIPLTIRRLHDTGHSGWWLGAGFIWSVVGAVIVLVNANTPSSVYIEDDFEAMVQAIVDIFFTVPMLIWYFVSFIYGIVMLVFMCTGSQPVNNKYGPSPKYSIPQKRNAQYFP